MLVASCDLLAPPVSQPSQGDENFVSVVHRVGQTTSRRGGRVRNERRRPSGCGGALKRVGANPLFPEYRASAVMAISSEAPPQARLVRLGCLARSSQCAVPSSLWVESDADCSEDLTNALIVYRIIIVVAHIGIRDNSHAMVVRACLLSVPNEAPRCARRPRLHYGLRTLAYALSPTNDRRPTTPHGDARRPSTLASASPIALLLLCNRTRVRLSSCRRVAH